MLTVSPELAGFSSARLRRLAAAMQGHIDKGLFPGVSVIVARHGQVVYAESLGLRDVQNGLPMTLDTICRIYSMTKPITSLAAMMLFEEGRFNLYDPLEDFIPAFGQVRVWQERGPAVALERSITIRDLFVHTAGLTYGVHDTPVDQMYREARLWGDEPEPSLEHWVGRLAARPLACQPGTRWQYSCATDVLGYLVQLLSGQRLGVFLRERMFRPLGMSDTDFYVPDNKQERFAKLYTPAQGAGFEEIPNALNIRYDPSHAMMSGGGGLVSTPLDYLRFAQMLANGGHLGGVRILGRKTLDLMRSNHLCAALLPYSEPPTTFHGYGFGLGFAVLMDPVAAQTPGSVGSYGWSGAASTDYWVDPEEDMVALMMPQVIPQPFGPIAREFRTLVYQALVN